MLATLPSLELRYQSGVRGGDAWCSNLSDRVFFLSHSPYSISPFLQSLLVIHILLSFHPALLIPGHNLLV